MPLALLAVLTLLSVATDFCSSTRRSQDQTRGNTTITFPGSEQPKQYCYLSPGCTMIPNSLNIPVTPAETLGAIGYANSTPSINSIFPSAVPIGNNTFELKVTGQGFSDASVVQWNGSDRPTTYGAGQLTVRIFATDVLSLGNFEVTVFNPDPDGGLSAPAIFSTYLSLPNRDLVYDSHSALFWVSVPSSAGSKLGNSVVSIDPYTGVIGSPIWVGSEPNHLSVSADGTTLWVTLDGAAAFRKVDLVNRIATPVQISIPGNSHTGNIYPTSLAVPTTSPNSVAVATGVVYIYDDAVKRDRSGSSSVNAIVFGSDATSLYGISGSTYSIYTVDDTGITSTVTKNLNSYSNDLRFDNGRAYLTSGAVLDASTGALLGTFAANGPVAADSAVGRTFILDGQFGSSKITAFDQNTFVPVDSVPVSGVGGGSPSALVRWDADGLAFRTDTQIYVLRGKLVRDLSDTPADLAVNTDAPDFANTGESLKFTVTVTNNGPNQASNVSLVNAIPPGAIFVSATPSQGNCSGSQVVRCNLGTLANNSRATMIVVVTPTTSGIATNSSTVSAREYDPDNSNNSTTATTMVNGSDYNSVPTIASLSPASAKAGSSTLTLTVNGSGFVLGSSLQWNGTELPTTWISETQLTATVDATLVASMGFGDVAVSSPGPGGGNSGALPFTVFQSVALDTNDIAFDPFTQKIYASVPSTAPQLMGNTIVGIDPVTATPGTPVFIGSEPRRVSISDDGQYLYLTLAGSNEVRRLDLPSQTPSTRFTYPYGTPDELAVMPDNHDAVATSRYASGVQVWDFDGDAVTQRGASTSIYSGNFLSWTDSSHLYSYDSGLSPSKLHRFSVGTSSLTELDATNLSGVWGHITSANGLLYSDGGGVADPSPAAPAPPQLVARYSLPSYAGSSYVDSGIGRVFFLNGNQAGLNTRRIWSFDRSLFLPRDTLELSGIPGDAFDLIRWGSDGLAFRTMKDFWGNGSGQIILLRGPSVLPHSLNPNPVPTLSSASPNGTAVGSGNLWITLSGADFVSGAVVLWDEAERSSIFLDSSKLKVAIPASDLQQAKTVLLRIVNPGPGGGTSAELSFNVY